MSCYSILVKNSIQLVADEPLRHGVGYGHYRQSNPLLQLFLGSLEFFSDNLQDKRTWNDISGYIVSKLPVCCLMHLKPSGIQSIVTLTILALQRFMMVTR